MTHTSCERTNCTASAPVAEGAQGGDGGIKPSCARLRRVAKAGQGGDGF